MKKVEYRKTQKEMYLPKEKPTIITIPSMRFAAIEGVGNPNGSDFSNRTGALYAFSYAVKMSYKSENPPEGYYDYTVYPLEGIWDLIDKKASALDKDNFKYTIMIRQPDFLTDALFESFLERAYEKKKDPFLKEIKYITIEDGLCCQMMHAGSYDDEPASFKKMIEFVEENGYERAEMTHREIYLSDPRKTSPEKLKTVLRFKVRKK